MCSSHPLKTANLQNHLSWEFSFSMVFSAECCPFILSDPLDLKNHVGIVSFKLNAEVTFTRQHWHFFFPIFMCWQLFAAVSLHSDYSNNFAVRLTRSYAEHSHVYVMCKLYLCVLFIISFLCAFCWQKWFLAPFWIDEPEPKPLLFIRSTYTNCMLNSMPFGH